MWMDHITMEQRRAGTALVGRSQQPDQFHASSMNSRCPGLPFLGPSSISLHRGQDVLGTVSYRRN
jgi:hypothetical protein